MIIGLLARGDASDAVAARWAAGWCRAGDDIEAVAPYVELAVSGCAWTPAVRAADAHRDGARLVAATAAAQLTGATTQQLQVGHSAVQGTRPSVLAAFAQCCDLLVSGVPAAAQVADAVTQAVFALAAPDGCGSARGGIVLVPQGWSGVGEGAGTVVVVGSHDPVRCEALHVAVVAGVRLRAELVLLTHHPDPHEVLEPSRPGLDTSTRGEVESAARLGVVPRLWPVDQAITDRLRATRGLALVICDWSTETVRPQVRDAAAVALGELGVPALVLGRSVRRW